LKLYATCPVCDGTGREPVKEHQQRWKTYITGWDPSTDSFACQNCGGQTMYGNATGQVPVNPETGKGCIHEYTGRERGRCYWVYTCKHCHDEYFIDSSD
jgi:RecJ-like exonuclease